MNNEETNQEVQEEQFFTASTIVEKEETVNEYAGLEIHPEIFCG